MKDRTYWRAQETARLIDDARYSGHELCIALGERLEDEQAARDETLAEARQRAADFEIDCNQLDDKVYELRFEIEKLELMLSQRDEEIERLKKGAKA